MKNTTFDTDLHKTAFLHIFLFFFKYSPHPGTADGQHKKYVSKRFIFFFHHVSFFKTPEKYIKNT